MVTLLLLLGWLLQAAVGLVMFTRSPHRRQALTHVIPAIIALALFVVFVFTEEVLWVWLSFAAVTVANTFGDRLLIERERRLTGVAGSFGSDYRTAIRGVFKGRFPAPVAFHGLFAGVVYFGTLALALRATLS
jgi:hypothetical protein